MTTKIKAEDVSREMHGTKLKVLRQVIASLKENADLLQSIDFGAYGNRLLDTIESLQSQHSFPELRKRA